MTSDLSPKILYHYTDLSGLKGIVRSHSLWASDIKSLNDESEVQYSRDFLKSLTDDYFDNATDSYSVHLLKLAITGLATATTHLDTFVASLCEDGDNLSQWRAYGSRGAGVAIGFDYETLCDVASDQDYTLLRVIYKEDEQRNELEPVISDSERIIRDWGASPSEAPAAEMQVLLLGFGLLTALMPIKNPAFRDEHEWRLERIAIPGLSDRQTLVREGSRGEISYEEVIFDNRGGQSSLTQVVLGPTFDSDSSEAEVRVMLDTNGLADVAIARSKIPLRH